MLRKQISSVVADQSLIGVDLRSMLPRVAILAKFRSIFSLLGEAERSPLPLCARVDAPILGDHHPHLLLGTDDGDL